MVPHEDIFLDFIQDQRLKYRWASDGLRPKSRIEITLFIYLTRHVSYFSTLRGLPPFIFLLFITFYWLYCISPACLNWAKPTRSNIKLINNLTNLICTSPLCKALQSACNSSFQVNYEYNGGSGEEVIWYIAHCSVSRNCENEKIL